MILKEQSNYKGRVKKLLDKMNNISKWQYDFILEIFGLFINVKS